MKLLTKIAAPALFAGVVAIADASAPLINLIGDRAPVVLSINDLPSLRKNFETSPWAKTWHDDQVQKLLAPALAQVNFDEIEAKVKAETGHTIEELLAFATGDALVALTTVDIDFTAPDAKDHMPFLIAIELGKNGPEVQKLLEADRKKSPGQSHETEDYAGVTLNIETIGSSKKEGEEGDNDTPERAYWAITDGVWIFGFDRDTVIGAIDAFTKGGADNAYGKSDAYLATRQKTGDAQFNLFINFRGIVERLQQEVAKQSADAQPNPFMNPSAIIPALGLDAWKSLYICSQVSETQTVMTGGFTFSEERGLTKMFSYGAGPVARPSFVAAKWISVTSTKFSLKNFYNGLEEMIGAYNPGVLGMAQMYLNNFNQQLGIDIKRDFFGSFGPDMINAYAQRPGANPDLPAPVEDLDQFLAFSLDNPKAFTNALNALLNLGGPQSQQMIVKREYLGTTINTMNVPAQGTTPPRTVSYAVAKNYLMLSVGSPSALEAALQDGPSFWDRKEVKQALAGVPANASSIAYQDTSAMLASLFQTFIRALNANPDTKEAKPIDPKAAPTARTLAKYWNDSIGYVVRDSQGYFFKSTLEHKK